MWEQQDEFQDLSVIEVEHLFRTLVVDSLQLLSNSSPNIFFILDGINECPQSSQKGIVKFLKLLQNYHLHILVTSQPTPDLIGTISPSARLELHEYNNRETIDSYIKARLAANPELLNQFQYVDIDPSNGFRSRRGRDLGPLDPAIG